MNISALFYLLLAFVSSALATLIVFPWLLNSFIRRSFVASLGKKIDIVSRIASAVVMPCSIIGGSMVLMIMLENTIYDYAIKLSIQFVGAGTLVLYLIALLEDTVGVNRWLRLFLQLIIALSFPVCNIYIPNLCGLFGIYELSYLQGSILTVIFVMLIINAVKMLSASNLNAIVLAIILLGGFCFMFVQWGLPVFYISAVSIIGSLSVILLRRSLHKEMQDKGISLYNSASVFLGVVLAYLAIKAMMINDYVGISNQDGFPVAFALMFLPCADFVRVHVNSLFHKHNLFSVNRSQMSLYGKLETMFMGRYMITTIILSIYAIFFLIDMSLLSWGLNITWTLLINTLFFAILNIFLPNPKIEASPQDAPKRILFCDNTLWGLINFRGDIINYYLKQGYDVYLVAPEKEDKQMVIEVPKGVTFISVAMGRTSTSPLNDLRYFLALWKIYGKIRPHYCFHYTIKPNIYGSIVASLRGVECTTAMIAGLGYVFSNKSIAATIARLLYKIGLRFTDFLFVLNEGNRSLILQTNLCGEEKVILLNGGEGVNTQKFSFYDNSPAYPVTFTFIGRVLYDKGYAEFVEAAEIVKAKYPETQFEIWGPMDPQFPNAVPLERLQFDVGRNIISYKGFTNNTCDIYNRSGIVVTIPSSYHEGMNRSLMEACSTGKPIICTRIHGCMELVREGMNGYTVPTHDGKALAAAMLKYISLSEEEKLKMSAAARSIAERDFSIESVIEKYKKIVR